MTRKDYVAISGAFVEVLPLVKTENERLITHEIAFKLSQVMRTDNPRFDEAVFLRACRVI